MHNSILFKYYTFEQLVHVGKEFFISEFKVLMLYHFFYFQMIFAQEVDKDKTLNQWCSRITYIQNDTFCENFYDNTNHNSIIVI